MSNENQNGKPPGPIGGFKVKIQSSGTDYWLVVPATAGSKCWWTTTKGNATTASTVDGKEVEVKNWQFGSVFIKKDGDNVVSSASSDANWHTHQTSAQDPVMHVATDVKTRYLDRRGGNGSDMNDAVLTTLPIITRDTTSTVAVSPEGCAQPETSMSTSKPTIWEPTQSDARLFSAIGDDAWRRLAKLGTTTVAQLQEHYAVALARPQGPKAAEVLVGEAVVLGDCSKIPFEFSFLTIVGVRGHVQICTDPFKVDFRICSTLMGNEMHCENVSLGGVVSERCSEQSFVLASLKLCLGIRGTQPRRRSVYIKGEACVWTGTWKCQAFEQVIAIGV